MQIFRKSVLPNCIAIFDAEQVYLKPQVTNVKNKEVTANQQPQTLEKIGLLKTLSPKPKTKFTLNPKPKDLNDQMIITFF